MKITKEIGNCSRLFGVPAYVSSYKYELMINRVRACMSFLAFFGLSFCGLSNYSFGEAGKEDIRTEITRVVQLVQGNPFQRNYPNGLPTLLEEISKISTLKLSPDPVFIESFDDPVIFKYPFIYVNSGDRKDWTLSNNEKQALRDYLKRGGFIYIDAGINASFLQGHAVHGQRHSFAEWKVSEDIKTAFEEVFPQKAFRPIPRSHALFRSYYVGLPDAVTLPETVREFVVNEKWPQGTYAAMGMEIDGRLAVLAMPIVAMGWGKNETGKWTTFIGFRVREGAEGLSERLAVAAYSGARFEVTREDGRQDVIFAQKQALPAWVQEPGESWRVFRYYHAQEISDYAHEFYTRLGTNVFTYVFTQ